MPERVVRVFEPDPGRTVRHGPVHGVRETLWTRWTVEAWCGTQPQRTHRVRAGVESDVSCVKCRSALRRAD